MPNLRLEERQPPGGGSGGYATGAGWGGEGTRKALAPAGGVDGSYVEALARGEGAQAGLASRMRHSGAAPAWPGGSDAPTRRVLATTQGGEAEAQPE